jgi:uncharacterized protein (DUF433 family)
MTQAVDYQRIRALATAIEELTQEERAVLEDTLRQRAVESTPGVCGGYARLRGTRIPIWTLVSLRQQGASDDELLRNYPTLTSEKLHIAWDYYDRHRAEVDQIIISHQECRDSVRILLSQVGIFADDEMLPLIQAQIDRDRQQNH